MSATFVKSVVDLTQMPATNLPQVALFGRSNAGKSTLVNTLTGIKKLSRVSNTPGRTRTINVFDVDHRWYLIDLPGYGYTKTSKDERDVFQGFIHAYIDGAEPALCIILVDAGVGPTSFDEEAIRLITAREFPLIILANKIDKLNQSEKAKAVKAMKDSFPTATIIQHSSLKSIGTKELNSHISNIVTKKK